MAQTTTKAQNSQSQRLRNDGGFYPMYAGGRVVFEYDPERELARVLVDGRKEVVDIRNWMHHIRGHQSP